MNDAFPLDETQVRVLAVLAEKEQLTPDSYPMSLNALVNGCNQLSSRDPVMALSETQVRDALDQLISGKLVAEVSQAGARVPKYEHRMRLRWALEQDRLAALVILMLRGPQTAAEIRNRAGRLHDYANAAAVEEALQFLIDKYPPLVAKLTRSPGTKEARYAHLLVGEPAEVGDLATAAPLPQDRVSQLEAEVAQLKDALVKLSADFAEIRRLLD